MTNAEYLYAQLRPIIATRTTAEWLTFCRQNKIPVGAVEGLNDIVRDYPVADHPVVGSYRLVPPPVRFSVTPAQIRQPAPMPGEHTEELLLEAGLDEPSLASMEKRGIIRRRPAKEPVAGL